MASVLGMVTFTSQSSSFQGWTRQYTGSSSGLSQLLGHLVLGWTSFGRERELACVCTPRGPVTGSAARN